jgi:hypothetical protein
MWGRFGRGGAVRCEDAAFRETAIECVRVYPNGFVVEVSVLLDPRTSQRPDHPMRQPPRLGVRFADGSEAGRHVPQLELRSMRKDDRGVPIGPVVRMIGGGGGPVFRTAFWVFSLPPAGPVDVFVSWPAVAPGEGLLRLEGADLLAASQRAQVIWG